MKRYLSLFVVLAVVLSLFVSLASARAITLDALDVDGNEDGVVNAIDLLMAARSIVGMDAYCRKFDITFKGSIDITDLLWIAQSAVMGLNLEQIRGDIVTGEKIMLTWPDGWSATLRTLVDDALLIQKFTGMGASSNGITGFLPIIHGWVHGTAHRYILGTFPIPPCFYVCADYSSDMTLSAYKTLGYGAFISAISKTHAYNTWFTGGDWHNLNNWRLLEPTTGTVWPVLSGGIYDTKWFCFPTYINGGQIMYHFLSVDSLHPTTGVTYDLAIPSDGGLGLGSDEEHLPPDYIFNTAFNP